MIISDRDHSHFSAPDHHHIFNKVIMYNEEVQQQVQKAVERERGE